MRKTLDMRGSGDARKLPQLCSQLAHKPCYGVDVMGLILLNIIGFMLVLTTVLLSTSLLGWISHSKTEGDIEY